MRTRMRARTRTQCARMHKRTHSHGYIHDHAHICHHVVSYLSKQSGGKTGGPSKGEVLRKWDKRYFVLCADQTHLRYYRSKEEFNAGKDPVGLLDSTGATLRVEREPGLFSLHLITPLRSKH